MEHDFHLALAFIAGTDSFTHPTKDTFDDYNLECECNNCRSEFARGYASELNYKFSLDNWIHYG